MCIIIYRPAEHGLTEDVLERCAKANKDGWGIMYPGETGLIRHNGMKFDEFLKVYNSIPTTQEMGIHFRIKTHGNVNVENTHPFSVLETAKDGEDMMLMHNGVINIKEEYKGMSDTFNWVELVLRPILLQTSSKLMKSHSFQFMVGNSISSSRMLILNDEGEFIFINEDSWKKNGKGEDGCLYSTTVPQKPYVYTPPAGTTPYQQGSYAAAAHRSNFYAGRKWNKDSQKWEEETVQAIGGGVVKNDAGRFPLEAADKQPISISTTIGTVEGDATQTIVTDGGADRDRNLVGEVGGDTKVSKAQKLDGHGYVFTPDELEEMFKEEMGLLQSDRSPLGIEPSSTRMHIMQAKGFEPIDIDPMPSRVFVEAEFDEILEFVNFYPEEVSLLLWHYFNGI